MCFEDSMNVQTGGAAKPVLVGSRWLHFLRKCTRGHRLVLCALSAFFTLSSYAGSLFYIPPSDGHVEFSADVFRDSEATVVRAYGVRQNQEYLLLQGQGAQAELILPGTAERFVPMGVLFMRDRSTGTNLSAVPGNIGFASRRPDHASLSRKTSALNST